MQVPSLGDNIHPQICLKCFCDDIPVLALIGVGHMIDKSQSYSVDEDVQLVCKYLKAYSVGGTKGIDRLYREGMIHIFFSITTLFAL